MSEQLEADFRRWIQEANLRQLAVLVLAVAQELDGRNLLTVQEKFQLRSLADTLLTFTPAPAPR